MGPEVYPRFRRWPQQSCPVRFYLPPIISPSLNVSLKVRRQLRRNFNLVAHAAERWKHWRSFPGNLHGIRSSCSCWKLYARTKVLWWDRPRNWMFWVSGYTWMPSNCFFRFNYGSDSGGPNEVQLPGEYGVLVFIALVLIIILLEHCLCLASSCWRDSS